MKAQRTEARRRVLFPLFLAFVCGGGAGWYLRGGPSRPGLADVVLRTPAHESAALEPPTITSDPRPAVVAPVNRTRPADLIADLRSRELQLPLTVARVDTFRGQFSQSRDGGARGHEAVDMLAPRNTPVYAVDNGTIARLFVSKAGGNTIYQFDTNGEVCYYYAHLERYASGLDEGQGVKRGDLLGYVGTSGNAPKDTPHLHFAIFELTTEKRWWKGTAIDPFLIYGAE